MLKINISFYGQGKIRNRELYKTEVPFKIKFFVTDSILYNRDTSFIISVKSKSRFLKIGTEEILFIEALKDYVIIHTNSSKFTIHSTMKEIERKFDFDNFVRVHRSYIVNTNKIAAIEQHTIIIEDHKKEIPIGGSYREKFIRKMKWV